MQKLLTCIFFASGASAIIWKINFKIPVQEIAEQQTFACLDMESDQILKNLLCVLSKFVSFALRMHPFVFSNDAVLCGYKLSLLVAFHTLQITELFGEDRIRRR